MARHYYMLAVVFCSCFVFLHAENIFLRRKYMFKKKKSFKNLSHLKTFSLGHESAQQDEAHEAQAMLVTRPTVDIYIHALVLDLDYVPVKNVYSLYIMFHILLF